ncbi:cellulose biosynthesis protein BcsD [Alcaligenes sp. SDU_A2]|uniref:cellulose biosynthesis protein BcsD n=1 Tax=Alcaligenes sp. SDU_A2 TaxID=3136634 RepID=UPI00311F543E
MNKQTSVLAYLSAKNCSNQWAFFLQALGKELNEAMPAQDVRVLMRQIGLRAGAEMPLSDCNTVKDIQAAANRYWSEFNWGWVELTEQSSSLELRHFCAPLLQAFGAQAQSWSPAFLEGVYQQWLSSLGAGQALQVRQQSELDPEHSFIDFRLSL